MLPKDEALMELADNDCYCELCNREAVPKLLRRIDALRVTLAIYAIDVVETDAGRTLAADADAAKEMSK